MLDRLQTRARSEAANLRLWWRAGYRQGRQGMTAAQVETILTILSLGLVILVGILIYSEVNETVLTGADANDKPNNTELENAKVNATEDYGNAMELAPVIMIILVASVVIGIVSRFQG